MSVFGLGLIIFAILIRKAFFFILHVVDCFILTSRVNKLNKNRTDEEKQRGIWYISG